MKVGEHWRDVIGMPSAETGVLMRTADEPRQLGKRTAADFHEVSIAREIVREFANPRRLQLQKSRCRITSVCVSFSLLATNHYIDMYFFKSVTVCVQFFCAIIHVMSNGEDDTLCMAWLTLILTCMCY